MVFPITVIRWFDWTPQFHQQYTFFSTVTLLIYLVAEYIPHTSVAEDLTRSRLKSGVSRF
jgi:hypothetical protein